MLGGHGRVDATLPIEFSVAKGGKIVFMPGRGNFNYLDLSLHYGSAGSSVKCGNFARGQDLLLALLSLLKSESCDLSCGQQRISFLVLLLVLLLESESCDLSCGQQSISFLVLLLVLLLETQFCHANFRVSCPLLFFESMSSL
jgi:hypothetical protein